MRATEEVLAALSCPLGDAAAVESMRGMTADEVLAELEIWLNGIKYLNPELQLVTATPESGKPILNGSFQFRGEQEVIAFVLVSDEQLRGCTTDQELESLAAVEGSDVVVLCMNVDADDADQTNRLNRLLDLSASPAPRWLVLEPSWLAAGVVLKAKPFVHRRMKDDNAPAEPYFTPDTTDDGPTLSRTAASTRRTLDSIRLEPRSLPEKVREASLRSGVASSDSILVTTFLPPITHSVTALVRYYSETEDDDTARQLIGARQQAERKAWEAHVSQHDSLLIVDRQQLEEYFEAPEYYQMALTPDELDEQVANFTAMLQHDRFSVAFCPDAIDIPFLLEEDRVDIRGDRRNKSEPRPGRVNGLTITDRAVVEELRREAGSLAQLTETQFKDKQFVQWWIEWLADSYRRSRHRQR